jgi:hypothetical protein
LIIQIYHCASFHISIGILRELPSVLSSQSCEEI